MTHSIPHPHVIGVCRLGAGRDTCSYLTFGETWECAKGTDLQPYIASRRSAGGITALGDNCPGITEATR